MTNILGIVRLKGNVGTDRSLRSALVSLGMKKTNTVVFLPDTLSVKGLLKKCNSIITWGEVTEEWMKAKGFDSSGAKMHGKGKVVPLSPPRGGFKSFHHSYPRGDLGYRGDKIKDLIERMASVK